MLSRRSQISLGLTVGIALTIVLGVSLKAGEIWEVFGRVQVADLALLTLLQAAAVVLCGAAWWMFTPEASLLSCTTARYIRDGATSTVAILPGTGEVVATRALTLFGTPVDQAAGSAAIDLAAEVLSQVLLTALGVGALLLLLGPGDLGLALAVLAGAAVPCLVFGLAFLRPSVREALMGVLSRAAHALGFADRVLRDTVHVAGTLWRDRGRFALGTLIHLLAWLLAAGQIWAGAHALGQPVSPAAALALTSLVHAARAAFFVVPWAVGVQEAGFALFGPALGLSEPAAIALSLTLRVRDLLMALPALAIWAAAEAREVYLRARQDRA
jgi:uncharacterized membrane protein YbhN (UPF0104 family)